MATAVSPSTRPTRHQLYEQLLKVAKRKTAVADTKFDERGQPFQAEEDFGDNVLIVDPATLAPAAAATKADAKPAESEPAAAEDWRRSVDDRKPRNPANAPATAIENPHGQTPCPPHCRRHHDDNDQACRAQRA